MCRAGESLSRHLACPCRPGLGVARRIPELRWVQLPGRSFYVDLKPVSLKHQSHGCSFSFWSDMHSAYSLFPGTAFQVFKENSHVSLSSAMKACGTRGVGCCLTNKETENVMLQFTDPLIHHSLDRYWRVHAGPTPLLPGTLWEHWGKFLVYLPSRIYGQWGGY